MERCGSPSANSRDEVAMKWPTLLLVVACGVVCILGALPSDFFGGGRNGALRDVSGFSLPEGFRAVGLRVEIDADAPPNDRADVFARLSDGSERPIFRDVMVLQ